MPEDPNRQPPPHPPRIDVQLRDDVVAITFPAQRIDGVVVRELYETVMQMPLHHRLRVLIDLGQLPYISSGLIGILITLRRKLLSADSQLHLIAPDPVLHEPFKVMKVDRLLKIYETEQQALQAFH